MTKYLLQKLYRRQIQENRAQVAKVLKHSELLSYLFHRQQIDEFLEALQNMLLHTDSAPAILIETNKEEHDALRRELVHVIGVYTELSNKAKDSQEFLNEAWEKFSKGGRN